MFKTKNSLQKISFYAYWLEKCSMFLMLPLMLTVLVRWTQDKIPLLKDMDFWIPYIDRDNVLSYSNSLHYLNNMPPMDRVFGFLLDGVTMVILMAALFYSILLMHCFRNGEIFSVKTISLLRRVNILVLLWAAYTPIHCLLMGMVAFHENTEQRALSMAYATDDALMKLLLFGFILVITLIMREGYRLQNEQDLTV